MRLVRPFWGHSLGFKIGITIVLIEALILTWTGILYVHNFNREIDTRIRESLLLPSVLMNKGMLELSAVTERSQMKQLVGEELLDVFIVGVNGNIFLSLNDAYTGRLIQDLPGIDLALISGGVPRQATVCLDHKGHYVTVAPLFAADQSSVRFYLYAMTSSAQAQDKKEANIRLFLLSSLATLLVTSLVIFIAFNLTVFRPLRQILSALRLVEAGDLGTRLAKTSSRDELGNLVVAFNTMVAQLQSDSIERKRAQGEIGQINHELEQRVMERTAELQAVNKELEAFSYSVSHDLRAPLRHIDGFLDLLRNRASGSLDEKSLHYMDTISNAAKRMGMLIDDLLAFSRMGRSEMVSAKVALDVLLQEVIQEFDLQTQGRAIDWRIGALPVVAGDRAMLHVVLVNLISNALKFTQKRAKVSIEIGCLPDSESEVVVFVRDNGAGFSMQYVHKLFGVFQRLHGAGEFEGTGIGLANVHRVISRHGGRTWAEGVEGGGATFYFSLPRV